MIAAVTVSNKKPTQFDYQIKATNKLNEWINNGIDKATLIAPCGAGKCLGLNTPVLKFDGAIVPVQNLQIGDRLMSPFGGYETITSLAKGQERMYRVIPKSHSGFDSWECNESHILSLKVWDTKTQDEKFRYKGNLYFFGDVINLSVKEYLTFKFFHPYAAQKLKLYKTSVDSFANSLPEEALPLPAYSFGVWLGDGTHNYQGCTTITLNNTNKLPVADSLKKDLGRVLPSLTLEMEPYTNGKNGLSVRIRQKDKTSKENIFRNLLCKIFDFETMPKYAKNWELFIPEVYKKSSYQARLSLLAGILDADGYFGGGYRNGSNYSIRTISKTFALDLQFIARSLGFNSTVQHVKQAGYSNQDKIWRVIIGGNNIEKIPTTRFNVATRIKLNQDLAKITPRDYSVCGFDLEDLGEGDYYGFELTGKRLFMLGDFSVTHNTSVTSVAIEHQIKVRKKIWVLVDRVELLAQWKAELLKWTDLKPGQIGIIHDKNPVNMFCPVQIVMIQTLKSGNRIAAFPDGMKPDVVYVDESHTVGFDSCLARLRDKWEFIQVNLTATPVRHPNEKVQYEDVYPKDLWFEVTTPKHLIQIGRWKQPLWKLASDRLFAKTLECFENMKVKGGDYDIISQANLMISLADDHIQEWLDHEGDQRSTVWFCVNVAHAEVIAEKLKALGRKVQVISGKTKDKLRKDSIEAFKNGELTDLVNCRCLTTGFDAPIADCAVFLIRTMSFGLFVQMVGRVLRAFTGKLTGLLLDLAYNLGLHDFPEETDWLHYRGGKKLFRDPKLVICQDCGYRHQTIPTPIHPTNKKIVFQPGYGQFKDGTPGNLYNPLECHHCQAPVTYNPEILGAYGIWLQSLKAAKASGSKQKPPKFMYQSAGIQIGGDSIGAVLDAQTLYDFLLWNLIASNRGTGEGSGKNFGEELEGLLEKTNKRFEIREKKTARFEALAADQKAVASEWSEFKIKGLDDALDRYRMAFAYAYLSNRSPTWCFKFWEPLEHWTEEQARKALREQQKLVVSRLCHSIESKTLVQEWLLEFHDRYLTEKKERSAGVCKALYSLASRG